MTALFFQDEVFLDCSKHPDTSACTFTFKDKEIYLKHTLEIKPKEHIHRMTCQVDGQTFNFGAGRSTLGGGTFGTWPRIMIEGITYRFKIAWSMGEGQKGIKLEAENQEELDDVEGYLHIHTLPPQRRKQVIEEMKKTISVRKTKSYEI